jgi:hypothetical protein
MAKSKYEKYVVRKPAIVTADYKDVVPETDKIPNSSAVDTGPRVILSHKFVKETNTMVEYGLISGDVTVGGDEKNVTETHKHDYEEIFCFLGTNPKDTTDLGAEVEFWVGEGKDLEKIKFNTSSSIYIPPNVAHFPQIYRNVKRPVMTVVIMPNAQERVIETLAAKEK